MGTVVRGFTVVAVIPPAVCLPARLPGQLERWLCKPYTDGASGAAVHDGYLCVRFVPQCVQRLSNQSWTRSTRTIVIQGRSTRRRGVGLHCSNIVLVRALAGVPRRALVLRKKIGSFSAPLDFWF